MSRWNGASWESVPGAPPYGSVNALRAHGAELLAAGSFTTVGGLESPYVARLGAGSPSCYPNCDCSHEPNPLTVADFACFLTRFSAGDPYANCDGSATPPTLNFADFSCFVQMYAQGCR
jgi:hypothetical protein